MATIILTDELEKKYQRYLTAVEQQEQAVKIRSAAETELSNAINDFGKSVVPKGFTDGEKITLLLGSNFLEVARINQNTFSMRLLQ